MNLLWILFEPFLAHIGFISLVQQVDEYIVFDMLMQVHFCLLFSTGFRS